MKLAGIATNDPAHEYLKLFKHGTEARTNRRIEGEVYPGAQRRARAVADEVLGTDPALKEIYEIYKQVAESHRKKG